MGSAICLNGLCPYVPCKDYPFCIHIKEIIADKDISHSDILKGVKQ